MCELLTIAGQSLEAASQKSRERVGTYFGVMDRWQKSKALPSRIRFMVKDVVELRRSKWIPRREQLQVGPALAAQMLCTQGLGAETGLQSLLAICWGLCRICSPIRFTIKDIEQVHQGQQMNSGVLLLAWDAGL